MAWRAHTDAVTLHSAGRTPWGRVRLVAAVFAFWTGMGLFFASQIYILDGDVTWRRALQFALPRWYSWGLLAPAIAAVDRRLLSRQPLTARLAWHVPLMLGFTGVALALRLVTRPLVGNPWPQSIVVYVLERAYWDILIYAVIAGVVIARDYASHVREEQERSHRLQLEAVELERLLTEARLQTLRSQLQPHFLFNALNTISALTETEPRTARRLMEQLGQLLRASLRHASAPLVTLAEELTFLDDYLAIESVRFEGRISVSIHAEDDALAALVPGFLLQPLVENAIRHGVGPRLSGGRIVVSAERVGDALSIRVTDDGLGLPENWMARRDAGVGLRNTQARLAQLFPGRHAFRVAPAQTASGTTSGVVVEIRLPWTPAHATELREAAAPASASGS